MQEIETTIETVLDDLTARLERLEQVGQLGDWVLDLATNRLTASRWLATTMQLDRDAIEPSIDFETFLSVHCFGADATTFRSILSTAVVERMPFTLSHRLRSADHTDVHWVRHDAKPILDAAGNMLGFSAVAVRIDDERRAGEERQVFQKTLEQVQRDESTRYIASGLAHEISNLLHPVIMWCDLLSTAVEEGRVDGVADRLSQMQTAIRRTVDVVLTTLEYARDESDEPVLLTADDVIEDLRSFFDADLVARLAIDVTQDASQLVFRATRSGLVQIVLNLMKNADHASPPGSTISFALSAEGAAVRDDLTIVFSIVDQGSGFSSEALVKAMDPLFTTKPADLGSGIGLSVVRSIIERWGGDVSISNNDSVGACVELRLPAHIPKV